MKRIISLILAAIMVLCFAGCYADEAETVSQPTQQADDGKTHLWVVTELSMPDHANLLAKEMIKEMKIRHEDVVIDLDILPLNAQERAVYLENLRVQILAGDGPDVFLLPTGNKIKYMVGINEQSTTVELLFSDVTQSMYNGLFYDVSEFYDADTSMPKDRLMTGVMDAGCIDDARYVLPMHYNMPVLYADTTRLEESGLDVEVLESGILEMYQGAIDLGDELWACGVECLRAEYSLFPNAIDYESDNVNLTVEELSHYLQLHQQVKALAGNHFQQRNSIDVLSYITTNLSSAEFQFPMRVGDLDDMINYKMMAVANEVDMTAIPVRGADGTLTAEVTYYGAVSANSQNPALAYEYLSLFFSEEAQWDQYREMMKYGWQSSPSRFIDDKGLFAPGWPVLTDGAVQTIWNRIRSQNFLTFVDQVNNPKKLLGNKITDEDLPIFEIPVDQAVFPIVGLDAQFSRARNALNTNSDFDAVAEELIQDLQWHLAEG